jgi:hypothetical protein
MGRSEEEAEIDWLDYWDGEGKRETGIESRLRVPKTPWKWTHIGQAVGRVIWLDDLYGTLGFGEGREESDREG